MSIKVDSKLHKGRKKGRGAYPWLVPRIMLRKRGMDAISAKLLNESCLRCAALGSGRRSGVGMIWQQFYGMGPRNCAMPRRGFPHFDVTRKVTNCIAAGMSQFQICSGIIGREDIKKVKIGDFAPLPNMVIEDHTTPDNKPVTKPANPKIVEFFRKCAGYQINVRCLSYGQVYREGREECIYALLGLQGDVPELFGLNFPISARGGGGGGTFLTTTFSKCSKECEN